MNRRQKIEAFKRGAMLFDDYNYDLYNKFILVDPDRADNQVDGQDDDLGDFVPLSVSKSKKGGGQVKDMQEDN